MPATTLTVGKTEITVRCETARRLDPGWERGRTGDPPDRRRPASGRTRADRRASYRPGRARLARPPRGPSPGDGGAAASTTPDPARSVVIARRSLEREVEVRLLALAHRVPVLVRVDHRPSREATVDSARAAGSRHSKATPLSRPIPVTLLNPLTRRADRTHRLAFGWPAKREAAASPERRRRFRDGFDVRADPC